MRRLLTKLGELPGGADDPRPVRFVEPTDAATTGKLLDQLRGAWPATNKNELIIKQPDAKAFAAGNPARRRRVPAE